MEKVYDMWELQRLYALSQIDPYECLVKYQNYLEQYPQDYWAYSCYAEFLIMLGKFSEAQKINDFLYNKFHDSDNSFVMHNVFTNQLKLFVFLEKDEELYRFCLIHRDKIEQYELAGTAFYAKAKLGLLSNEEKINDAYVFQQMIEYSEDNFLKHVQRHFADYNKDVDEPNSSIFAPSFPFSEVLIEVKKHLLSEKRLYTDFFSNKYFFKYDCCGKDKNKTVNFFKVICFHNTKNIITMVASADCEQLPYIDLNYMKKELEVSHSKVHRMSQVDKFNQKYRR